MAKKNVWVQDLQKGRRVEEFFAVGQINKAKKKSGEDYLRFIIVDKTGHLEARIWDDKLASKMEMEISEGQIIQIRGVVVEYGGLQIHVDNYSVEDSTSFQEEDFRPFTKRDLRLMWNEITAIIEEINNPYIKELLSKIYGENQSSIMQCVAGKKVHHNYGGGLLEHTLEVVDFCKVASKHQVNINSDVLLAGALLHDVGKIFEYDHSKITYDTTISGKLLGGHVILGRDFIRDNYPADFPEKVAIVLEHLILSHHGQKEWGAVEEPKIIEAITLHYADLMSARINQAGLILSEASEGEWSMYDKFLGTSLFLHGLKP